MESCVVAKDMVELTFDGLKDFKGGLVQRMLGKALDRVAADMRNAADVSDWRKVQIEFRFRPTHDEGELSGVVMEIAVGDKVPHRITSGQLEVRRNGKGQLGLFFAIDSPDNPDQRTLGFPNDRESQAEG